MSSPEPGLDLHEWASEFASIEDEIADDPNQALVELTNLVERMLTARGFDVGDPVADEGDEREILASFRAAREVSRAVESAEELEADAVPAAIEDLRLVYEFLITERASP